MISNYSIAAMVFCVAVGVLAPIGVIVFFAKRVTMNISAMLLGFIMYVMFDSLFLNVFDTILMQQFATDIYDMVYSTPVGYTFYYAFIHALFYTVGFYVAVRMVMRSDTGVGSGIAVGIGCGAGNLVLSTAYPMVNNIIAATQINKNGIESFIADNTSEGIFSMEEALKTLTESSPTEIVIGGLDAVILFGLVVAVCVIIFLATTHRSPFGFIYVGMALFFAYQLFPAMYTVGIIKSIPLFVLFTLVCVSGAVLVAIWMAKKYGQNPLKY